MCNDCVELAVLKDLFLLCWKGSVKGCLTIVWYRSVEGFVPFVQKTIKGKLLKDVLRLCRRGNDEGRVTEC